MSENLKKPLNLERIKAPVIFRKTEDYYYQNPECMYKNGEFHLFFTKITKIDGEPHIYQMESTSKNLTFWSIPKELIENEANTVGNAEILNMTEGFGYYLKFYEGTADFEGCILLAVSKDATHWITFEQDEATYPENGVYYEGDYYKQIPFYEYIHREDLPEGQIFNIRDYGAIPDGRTLSTEAFRAAAEAVKAAGGGTILVTGGHYCIGTVHLYNNTTLFIDVDSALVASKNLNNYEDALLACVDADNVTIRGGGKIIGNGEYFVYLPLKKPLTKPLSYTKLPSYLYDPMGYPVDSIRYAYRSRIRYAEDRYGEGLEKIHRPMYTVWIRGSKNITLENIIIEDALDWTLDIDYSSYVKVKDLVIHGNRHVANTDGIDIMSSNHITIEHCFISCADDGLCIKAPRVQGHDDINVKDADAKMGPAKDIHISDCTVVSVMNAFKIGTETYFDIEDVTVENCKFMMPDIFPGSVSGISIESADGSHVRNVSIRNIEMDKVCCPVFICLNMRNKFGFVDEEDKRQRYYGGSIENVTIEHITAYDVEVPSILTGFELVERTGRIENRIQNITIRDFHAIYRDNEEILDIQDKIHESIYDYPENNAFGDVPAYGFYIRHANNVTLEELEIIPRTSNTRECIYKESVDGCYHRVKMEN